MARVELPARGLHLEFESWGDERDPAMLLVMGLGMQLVSWPRAFIDALVAGGLRVVAFDNRDAGLSGRGARGPPVDVARAFLAHLVGRRFTPPYTIADLAGDTLALADALGIERFHLVGVSLGGMVAQRVALAAPERVLSLTSIMSHAGSRTAPWPTWQMLFRFVRRIPASASAERKLAHFVDLFRALGRIDDEEEVAQLRERLKLSIARAYDPAATLRQLIALTADEDRRPELAQLRCSTLVIHGDADPLVPVAAAHTLAHALPAARLEIVPRLGHYLPGWSVPILSELVLAHVRAATAAH